MALRQVLPEAEATHGAQLGRVVQHAPADPRDLVNGRILSWDREAPLHVPQIGRAVQRRALPGFSARAHDLRLDMTVPELDVLLVRPDIVDERQPDEGTAYEPASLAAHRVDQALEQIRLADDVVVEEERIRRLRVVEQELTLLGYATARQVASDLDLVAARFEITDRCPHFGRGRGRARF